jgi:hypothetical protein
MRKYLAEHYYPWVQAKCPWFTDHGENHVQSVTHATNLLLSEIPDGTLSCLEAFILLSAIIWHDVGMVANRSGHAKAARTFIEKVRDFCFPDPTLVRLVTLIINAHSGKDGWAALQLSEAVAACPHNTPTIYPKALAAIIRFADEISETRTRISTPLLKKVPKPHRLYWEYANCVTASQPDPKRRWILLSLEVQTKSALQRYPCPKDFAARADGKGTISLIEYIVCRLEKMNNERVYCFPYLTRYAHIGSIVIRLQICQGVKCEVLDDIVLGEGGLADAGYPNIQLYDRFFENYPALAPASLKKRSAK